MQMQRKYDSIFTKIDSIIEFILFAITIAMLIAGVAQVVARYILQASLSWSEELMRYLYVWVTMIGASMAIRKKQFTAIEAIYNILKEKSPAVGKLLQSITTILQILFFVLLTWYGIKVAGRNMSQTSPAMGISIGLVYCAIPVGGFLGIIYCLIPILDRLRGGMSK